MMKSFLWLLSALALLAPVRSQDYVDFLVTAASFNVTDTDEYFIARITDPDMIATARSELEKEDGFKIELDETFLFHPSTCRCA